MDIRNYGEVVLCKNITFEDNKYDMEQGHPGVVILPTTERDEKAICIYMTSDKRKAKEKNIQNMKVNLLKILLLIYNK